MASDAERVFVDTNVVLDHMADRQPFAEFAHRIFALGERGELQLHISALSVCILYYLLRKNEGHARTLALLGKLTSIVHVTAIGEREIRSALGSGLRDFEDAVQLESAVAAGTVDALISRNPADFDGRRIRVYTPSEYLAVRSSRGR